MRGILAESIETLKTVGFKVFMIRCYDFLLFKIRRLLSGSDKINIQRFHSLKNKYKGQRIFILGNGPSLNEMPLFLLKNEYKMCFNRFFLMEERLNWKPDFFIITDNLLVKDMEEEINNTVVPNVKYAFFPDLHPSNVNFKKRISQKDNVYWLKVDKPGFSDNLPFCGINKTVVNAGIQVAAYLGFSEIYLLGVDMTFGEQKVKKINSRDWVSSEDDNNHFDPRYFSKGKSFHNPTVDAMLQRFDDCHKFYKDKPTSIYNAGYGGKLEAFPRKSFDSVLNIPQEKIDDIFISVLKSIDTDLTVDDFILYQENDVDCNFKVEKNKGIMLIKSLILSHIPIGPYNDFYFFVKRR